MTAEYDGGVIATARYSADAAADGQGAWIVSGLPRRLFTRNQAITAMALAERLAAGFGDGDLFVIGWHEELGLWRTGSSGSPRRSRWWRWPSWPRSFRTSMRSSWCGRMGSLG
jgi:hypothetical protein